MSENDNEDRMSAEEALLYLTPDNTDRLRRLSYLPENIIKAALPLIPLGSRIGMEVIGMVTRDGSNYELTPFGHKVMQIIQERSPS
jgi:hypothetical protein